MIGSDLMSIRKTGDQSVSSSTVLVNDTELSLPVIANEVYAIRLFLIFTLAGILSGYKFAISGPASPTNLLYAVEIRNLVTPAIVNAASLTAFSSSFSGALATTGNHVLVIEGLLENGVNPGSITVQFAQSVSDSGAITVKRGSFLTLFPMKG